MYLYAYYKLYSVCHLSIFLDMTKYCKCSPSQRVRRTRGKGCTSGESVSWCTVIIIKLISDMCSMQACILTVVSQRPPCAGLLGKHFVRDHLFDLMYLGENGCWVRLAGRKNKISNVIKIKKEAEKTVRTKNLLIKKKNGRKE